MQKKKTVRTSKMKEHHQVMHLLKMFYVHRNFITHATHSYNFQYLNNLLELLLRNISNSHPAEK